MEVPVQWKQKMHAVSMMKVDLQKSQFAPMLVDPALQVAPDGGAGAVEVEDARGVHDEGRPAEKLVRANACRSCTSRSALQARCSI